MAESAFCRYLCALAQRLGCECAPAPPAPSAQIHLALRIETDPHGDAPPGRSLTHTQRIGGPTVAIELPPGTRLSVTLVPTADDGTPAEVQEDTIVGSASDPDVISVEQDDDDPLMFKVRRVANGVAAARFEADSDTGHGVVLIVAEVEVAVTSGMATSLGLTTSVEDDV